MQFTGNTDHSSARYWNDLAELYQKQTRISTDDFHYGPLLPGDSTLQLLPHVENHRCLEIGCGAGQNSIFLAKKQAQCTAIDVSEQQLQHGRTLAQKEGVTVDFQCISMDALPVDEWANEPFDLIHSSYALPFSADPANVLATCAQLLKPGGTLLLTTGHPLYAGEWLDIGDGEDGVFLPNYFQLEPDVRMSMDDQTMNAAQYWPISQVAEWIYEAGLRLERLLEPAPVAIPALSKKEIRAQVPYESNDWRALYDQLARVPVVVIYKAIKPQ